jgi:hypothetical protein
MTGEGEDGKLLSVDHGVVPTRVVIKRQAEKIFISSDKYSQNGSKCSFS